MEGWGGWIGVRGNSNVPGSDVGIGVFGEARNGATNYAVYANGDLAYTGSLIHASDLRLKENLGTLDTVIPRVMDLSVMTFQHTSNPEYEHMNLPEGPQVGFIAQQVETVIPELVVDAVHPSKGALGDQSDTGDPIHYKALKTVQLIPYLVKAIQEQQAQIEELTAQIAPLENRLAQLEQSRGTAVAAAISP